MAEVRNAAELVADVEARIAAGQLRPGDRLDPVRTMAAEVGLAANTVAAAYRTLGERGLVVAEGRRGTFVTSRPPLAVPTRPTIAEAPPAGLIDLASGNPDPALLPELGPALAAIDTDHTLYGLRSIDERLAALLRADLAADGIDPTNLAVVGGALDGIERVLAATVRPGDRIAVEDPAYSSVIELLAAMGLRPEPMAIDQLGPRPEALAAALDRRATAVVFTPRAQNPTGAAVDATRAGELGEVLAARPEALVIEDDHAGRVAGQPYRSAIPPGHERWAVVRSVAKSLGPDLRLAALAGDPTTVARVTGRQALGTAWVSHLLQRTVAELLSAPEIDDLLTRAADTYTRRRQAVVEVLAGAGLSVHGRSGLNVWVEVEDEATAVAGLQHLGYAVRSGAPYRLVSLPGVRISIASTDEATLTEAAKTLLTIVAPSAPARSA